MTKVDWALLLILLSFMVNGAIQGLARQLFGLAGFCLGLVAAAALWHRFALNLAGLLPAASLLLPSLAFTIIFLGIWALWSIGVHRLETVLLNEQPLARRSLWSPGRAAFWHRFTCRPLLGSHCPWARCRCKCGAPGSEFGLSLSPKPLGIPSTATPPRPEVKRSLGRSDVPHFT